MTSKTSAYGEDPLDHNVPSGDGHNENEHHGEKQSLFKKVKAKAKKIKDSIKGHAGQGDDHDQDHDLDHDDVDENDNEIDTNPAIHGAHAARGVDIGKEDTAGQHGTDIGGKTTIDGINVRKDGSAGQHGTDIDEKTAVGGHAPGQHGTDIDEKTAVGGHAPVSSAGVDQVLNPTTTDYVPGQEEILGESRIDTLEPLGSGNKPHALSPTHDVAQSTGSHSTGNMGVTQKPKLGGILDKDSQVLKHVGEPGAPTGGDKEGISSPRGTDIAEGTTLGDHSPVGSPGVYQDFVPTTTDYVPGQEETLGWSRTDTGPVVGSENQPHELSPRPAIASSGGIEKDFHVPKHVGEDVYPSDDPAKVVGPTGGGAQDIGLGLGGGIAKQHVDYPREEESEIPVSEPAVENQTFDTSSPKFIPGEEETLGWSRTDAERSPNLSDEQPFAPKSTPKGQHHAGTLESGTTETEESKKFRGLIDRPTSLEKDPHSPVSVGENRYAENYDSDPTGRGGEEIGVTPIVQQLEKMNMHDRSSERPDPNVTTGQPEDLFTPSADQHQNMSGSPDISTNLSSRGLHDEHEQKPESYTEKVSSLASELANKAKVSTGYGVSNETPVNVSASPVDQPSSEEQNPLVGGYSDTHQKMSTGSHDQFSPEPVTEHQFDSTNPSGEAKPESYTEKISSLASELATQAKVATGYGVSNETPTNASTAPLGETDKGVSMKDYLAEKLKPGEEDKALSKVITEALPLHTPKEEHPDSQVTESDQEKEAVVVKGRVTESEEVANRLGRAEDKDYDGVGPGLASPGKSVMNRIMDATGSWFGGKSEPATEPVVPSAEGNAKTQTTPIKETQQ